jgi:hypothetical protein
MDAGVAAVHPLHLGLDRKPKGVLHTSAGYLVYAAYTHKTVFDWRDGDVYCCAADVGWITGHSYIVYGPLCNGPRPSCSSRSRSGRTPVATGSSSTT